MKKIINDPAQYTDDMLQGIYRAHGDQVGYVNGDLRCYCTKKKIPGKVAIITGGGTGHLPLFLAMWGRICWTAAPWAACSSLPAPSRSMRSARPWRRGPVCSISMATAPATS